MGLERGRKRSAFDLTPHIKKEKRPARPAHWDSPRSVSHQGICEAPNGEAHLESTSKLCRHSIPPSEIGATRGGRGGEPENLYLLVWFTGTLRIFSFNRWVKGPLS